jgi:hypothetical protein
LALAVDAVDIADLPAAAASADILPVGSLPRVDTGLGVAKQKVARLGGGVAEGVGYNLAIGANALDLAGLLASAALHRTDGRGPGGGDPAVDTRRGEAGHAQGRLFGGANGIGPCGAGGVDAGHRAILVAAAAASGRAGTPLGRPPSVNGGNAAQGDIRGQSAREDGVVAGDYNLDLFEPVAVVVGNACRGLVARGRRRGAAAEGHSIIGRGINDKQAENGAIRSRQLDVAKRNLVASWANAGWRFGETARRDLHAKPQTERLG